MIAKDCHIVIPPPKSMNLLKTKLEKSEFFYDTTEMDYQPINVNNFVKLYKSHSSEEPSTSSNYKQEDEAMAPADESKVETPEILENIGAKLSDDAEIEQSNHASNKRQRDSLKGAGDYKYGYEDIITGTFEEKLEKCLADGAIISMANHATYDTLNNTLYENYRIMIQSRGYKKMKSFREILPTYKKSKELLDVMNNNQVIVISGETGCGKSTQVTLYNFIVFH